MTERNTEFDQEFYDQVMKGYHFYIDIGDESTKERPRCASCDSYVPVGGKLTGEFGICVDSRAFHNKLRNKADGCIHHECEPPPQ